MYARMTTMTKAGIGEKNDGTQETVKRFNAEERSVADRSDTLFTCTSVCVCVGIVLPTHSQDNKSMHAIAFYPSESVSTCITCHFECQRIYSRIFQQSM